VISGLGFGFFFCFFWLGVVFGNLECGGVSLSLKFFSFLVSRVIPDLWGLIPLVQ
jgi:hypothetical protein